MLAAHYTRTGPAAEVLTVGHMAVAAYSSSSNPALALQETVKAHEAMERGAIGSVVIVNQGCAWSWV